MVVQTLQHRKLACFDACAEIVARGAIITLPGVPLRRTLVGALNFPRDGLAAVFPAFGERATDVQLLPYLELRVHAVGVCFMEGTQIRALLAPIEKSAVEDPDDYLVAWSLWMEVLPLRWPVIEQAFATATRQPTCMVDEGALGCPSL